MGALTGTRVLDLSSVLMGPFAAQMLGDMGADVIKVEPPTGDTLRAIGPMRGTGMGPLFLHSNRNKRSLVLDLKRPEGHAALLRLVKTADVLLYNIRPQAMARLGLAYADLRPINPGLIHAGAFGFGQDGPYAARPAFDDLIQGIAAIPTLVQMVGGDGPRYVPLAMVDRYVGVTASNAILGALVEKGRTGKGQAIEIPMFETLTQLVLSDHMGGWTFDPPLGPPGYPRSLAPERHPYQTRDGYVCAMIYTDRHWRSFFELVGQAQVMQEDARYRSITTRTQHAREIHKSLEEHMKDRTTAEWLDAFEQADIPATRLHTLESLFDDPHLKSVELLQWVEHPSEGRVRVVRPPSRWSESQPDIRRLPPRLGEHSAEILGEAGYSEDEIAGMLKTGVTLVASEAVPA